MRVVDHLGSERGEFFDMVNSGAAREKSKVETTEREETDHQQHEDDDDGCLLAHEEETIDEDDFGLEEDIYSLMFIAEYMSLGFALGILVLLMQLSTLSLALIDLLKDPPDKKNNPWNIPINVDPVVAVAQFVSLIVAGISQDDVFTSLTGLFAARYDAAILKRHPSATHAKWIFTNLLRLTEGLLLPVLSFVIVVQASEVLDIFMNFAALQFISEIDNLVFFLAAGGYLGRRMQLAAKRTNSITLPRAKHARKYLLGASMVTILSLLVGGWSVVRCRQMNGYYLNKQSSHSFSITFGDDFYVIPKNTTFILPEGRLSKPSKPKPPRRLRGWSGEFNTSDPPVLHYAFFSGSYKAGHSCDHTSCVNQRLIYYERNYEGCSSNPRCGKFYYCQALKAWVFTIEALGDATKEKWGTTDGKCEWGWLLQSPPTESFKLEDVPTTGWKIWTGLVSVPSLLTIVSDECRANIDCGLHGKCQDAVCQCEDGWRGTQCNVEKVDCGDTLWLDYGQSSEDFNITGPYKLLTNGSGSPVLAYDRTVYYQPRSSNNAPECQNGGGIWDLILYTGRRWSFNSFCEFDVQREIINGTALFATHAYWNNIYDKSSISRFSEATSSYSCLQLTWFEVDKTKGSRVSDKSLFVSTDPANAFMACLNVNCVVGEDQVCGSANSCQEWSLEEFNAGYLAQALGSNISVAKLNDNMERTTVFVRQCVCNTAATNQNHQGMGGYFCEIDALSSYTEKEREKYEEYLSSGNRSSTYEPGLYAKLFWMHYWPDYNVSGSSIFQSTNTT